jgi:hypothetical protein
MRITNQKVPYENEHLVCSTKLLYSSDGHPMRILTRMPAAFQNDPICFDFTCLFTHIEIRDIRWFFLRFAHTMLDSFTPDDFRQDAREGRILIQS